MTAPDSGVDQLFRQATDHLHPDVDRLVAGGLYRGRARRRRHLAGTAVAVVATFGVIGAGAAAVPHLGPEAARDIPVGTDGGTASPTPARTASPTPSAPPSPTPTVPPTHLSEPEGPTVAAAVIPQRVGEMLPGHQVKGPLSADRYPLVDEGSQKIVHFSVDGMLTTVVISRASASLAYDCTDDTTVECRVLPHGTVVQVSKPSTSDGVTMRSVLAIGETWMVDVMSYNAAEGKDVAPVRSEPALGEEELVALATSGAWFE